MYALNPSHKTYYDRSKSLNKSLKQLRKLENSLKFGGGNVLNVSINFGWDDLNNKGYYETVAVVEA